MQTVAQGMTVQYEQYCTGGLFWGAPPTFSTLVRNTMELSAPLSSARSTSRTSHAASPRPPPLPLLLASPLQPLPRCLILPLTHPLPLGHVWARAPPPAQGDADDGAVVPVGGGGGGGGGGEGARGRPQVGADQERAELVCEPHGQVRACRGGEIGRGEEHGRGLKEEQRKGGEEKGEEAEGQHYCNVFHCTAS